MPTLLSLVKRVLIPTGLLTAALAGPTATAQAEWVSFGDDQCQCSSVGVAANGVTYVGDASSARILVFAQDGTLARTITSQGGMSVSNVTDLELLPDGNFVVGKYNGLSIMTPDGGLVANVPNAYAADVAVDPSGNIYWTNYNSVAKRDAVTGEVTTIYTEANGQDTQLSGIDFSDADDVLYVTSIGDSRVLRLTPSGTFVGSIGSFGDGPSGFNRPADVAADDAGNVYVTDQRNFSSTGPQQAIKKFRRDGTPDGSFAPPLFSSANKLEWRSGSLYLARFSGMSKLALDDPIVSVSGPATLRTAQRATFSAANSVLPFGSITGYEWDFDGNGSFDTNTGSTPTATRRYDTEGDRVVRVRVTSSRGTTDTARVAMKVSRSVATLDVAPQVLTGQSVTLNAARSAQGDSDITNVRFDRDGDGSFETDAGRATSVEATYGAIGVVNPGVQVTREGGVVDVTSRAVTVRLAPPGGPVGASINAGAKYTNNPSVQLSITWPAFSQTVTVANDGGFQGARSFPVAPTVTATLDSSGPERLPKTVYARFDGSTQTLTDDIILDETRPSVSTATIAVPASSTRADAAAAKKRSYNVTLKASDKTSGVAKVQFARTKKKPSAAVRYTPKVTVRATAAPMYVRAQDRAGNFSAWKTLKTQRKAPSRK